MFNANLGVRTMDAPSHGLGCDTKCATATYTVSAAVTAGRVVPMVAVPAGSRIVDAKVSVDGISGGTYSLGDTGDASRFMATAAPGARMTKGDLYLYKQSSLLNLTVGTAPTGTSGAIRLAVWFVVDGVSPRDA